MKLNTRMVQRCICLVVFLSILLPNYSPAQAQEQSLTPKQILDKVDDLFRSQSSHGFATMSEATAHWKRSLSLEMWSKGKDKSLFRILAPKKEKGTATLRSGNDIWNYLPKVDRTIKIPSSMMGGSWMGSDFTNDDLVKESRMALDYHSKVTAEAKSPDGAIEITCIPKPKAAVVWGKIVVKVRKKDLIPLQIYYYKENGALARRMVFTDIKDFHGRSLPATMTVIPEDKKGHSTVVTYQAVRFDVGLPPRLFTVNNLRK